MPLLDLISGLASKIAPSKNARTAAAGIGSGHGMVAVDDDMIVSKPTVVLHASQIFFNFLAMACFASVAAFQANGKSGPVPGLTGFAIFVSVAGMCLSAFMLAVPVVYEKHDRLVRLARALKEVRVGFILTGTGLTFSLLIAFIVTISAWTEPGCKNAANDPNAEKLGDNFKNALPGWCSTKKAGAIFFWLAFGCWLASLVLLVLDWRAGKLSVSRDPPFQRPQAIRQLQCTPIAFRRSSEIFSTPSSTYTQPMAGRPSMDAYGAFSDPAPVDSGIRALPPLPGPMLSRTMQYADPYAAVRASIAGQPSTSPPGPPSYESYSGYR
ncbi:hypothetical protein CPB84DRAFT_1815505 [Gymnopilus junonius]|uniref:MARVEL domain-containing protein n=1 Tax=Gymnopilus junonius TaxID=109634 RepID=A0A9P5NMP1_GYMJU|nr:hypothetical protein CPB84DRAFT_1815505 [Gymnopilus junonius]